MQVCMCVEGVGRYGWKRKQPPVECERGQIKKAGGEGNTMEGRKEEEEVVEVVVVGRGCVHQAPK